MTNGAARRAPPGRTRAAPGTPDAGGGRAQKPIEKYPAKTETVKVAPL